MSICRDWSLNLKDSMEEKERDHTKYRLLDNENDIMLVILTSDIIILY